MGRPEDAELVSARRRAIVAAGVGLQLVAWSQFTVAQQSPADRRRIGALLYGSPDGWAFFRRDLVPALAKRGWIEGRNLSIDWRVVDNVELLPSEARALLGRGVDVVLTRGTPATRAFQNATTSRPIITGVGDPVGSGFAASLAAPGGNITGLSYATAETALKKLELLRELAGRLDELLVVASATMAGPAYYNDYVAVLGRVAREQRVPIQVIAIDTAADLQAAIKALRGTRHRGALVSNITTLAPEEMARAWLQAGIPTAFEDRGYVDAGGLMSYRFDWDDQTGRTAMQLDKVLRGTPPAQIPFEFPMLSQFVINARTAHALGIRISAALRTRADDVIE
jgi:putative ABC transport system substrate-binding protein